MGLFYRALALIFLWPITFCVSLVVLSGFAALLLVAFLFSAIIEIIGGRQIATIEWDLLFSSFRALVGEQQTSRAEVVKRDFLLSSAKLCFDEWVNVARYLFRINRAFF